MSGCYEEGTLYFGVTGSDGNGNSGVDSEVSFCGVSFVLFTCCHLAVINTCCTNPSRWLVFAGPFAWEGSGMC